MCIRDRDIAEELGVAHILEGSIQRANGRVRVIGQLIDAYTDKHIWAETYDRQETDIFDLQSDVAIEIAEAMKSQLTTDEKERINDKLTESTIAYEYYLKGNKDINQYSWWTWGHAKPDDVLMILGSNYSVFVKYFDEGYVTIDDWKSQDTDAWINKMREVQKSWLEDLKKQNIPNINNIYH